MGTKSYATMGAAVPKIICDDRYRGTQNLIRLCVLWYLKSDTTLHTMVHKI